MILPEEKIQEYMDHLNEKLTNNMLPPGGRDTFLCFFPPLNVTRNIASLMIPFQQNVILRENPRMMDTSHNPDKSKSHADRSDLNPGTRKCKLKWKKFPVDSSKPVNKRKNQRPNARNKRKIYPSCNSDAPLSSDAPLTLNQGFRQSISKCENVRSVSRKPKIRNNKSQSQKQNPKKMDRSSIPDAQISRADTVNLIPGTKQCEPKLDNYPSVSRKSGKNNQDHVTRTSNQRKMDRPRDADKPLSHVDPLNLNPDTRQYKPQQGHCRSLLSNFDNTNETHVKPKSQPMKLDPSCNPDTSMTQFDLLKLNPVTRESKPKRRNHPSVLGKPDNTNQTCAKPESNSQNLIISTHSDTKTTHADQFKQKNLCSVSFKSDKKNKKYGRPRPNEWKMDSLCDFDIPTSHADSLRLNPGTRHYKPKSGNFPAVSSKSDKRNKKHGNAKSHPRNVDLSCGPDTQMTNLDLLAPNHGNTECKSKGQNFTSLSSKFDKRNKKNAARKSITRQMQSLCKLDTPLTHVETLKLNLDIKQLKGKLENCSSVSSKTDNTILICETPKSNTRKMELTCIHYNPMSFADVLKLNIGATELIATRGNIPVVSSNVYDRHTVCDICTANSQKREELEFNPNILMTNGHQHKLNHTTKEYIPLCENTNQKITLSETVNNEQDCIFLKEKHHSPTPETLVVDGVRPRELPAIISDSSDAGDNSRHTTQDTSINHESLPLQQPDMSRNQTPLQNRMLEFMEHPPFIPWLPLVNTNIRHDANTDSNDQNLQHDEHPLLLSDDDGYLHSPDPSALLSDLDNDLLTPEMTVSLCSSPDSYCLRTLDFPIPQSQLNESRILPYLRTVRGIDNPSVEIHKDIAGIDPERQLAQFKHLQHMPVMQDSLAYFENQWTSSQSITDELKCAIALLNGRLHRIEQEADTWRYNFDLLTMENELMKSQNRFLVRNLIEQLEEEWIKCYNFQLNIVNLVNLDNEARIDTNMLETGVCVNQLSHVVNRYTCGDQMSASVATSESGQAAGPRVSQVQMVTTSIDAVYSYPGYRNSTVLGPQPRPQTEDLEAAVPRVSQVLKNAPSVDAVNSYPGIWNTSVRGPQYQPKLNDFTVYRHLYC